MKKIQDHPSIIEFSHVHAECPIIDGIPSFASAYEFDRHWDTNSCKEIPYTKKTVALQFLSPLFDYLKSHSSCHLLDAGCGDGVHVETLAINSDVAQENTFIGLDISLSALKIARKRRQTGWRFVQGNIGKLPFKKRRFDIVFSFGVLAYTDNPFRSFSELCRVLKVGGLIGVWIYAKSRGIKGALFSLVRKICRWVGPVGARLIADCIVPFLGFLPTRSKLSLANAGWKQCREIVLVNIAPKQLFFPELSEMEGWFAKHNIKIINCDKANPITLWGIKC